MFILFMTYYDEISEGYEELHREEQLKKVKLIRKLIKVDSSDKLLDVGCGTGVTTVGWGCELYGLDPAKKLLERAVDKDKITYVNAEAENIPFEDGFFDWVISITAIQNFRDIEKGLKEIKRVGKGKFVLTFLKKSAKCEEIKELIMKIFDVDAVVEEEKDLIFVVE